MVQWKVHGERVIYRSPWVGLSLTTVEPPGTEPFEHHVVRSSGPAAGCVVSDERQRILLIHRHRFITDTWGWEIPAGRVDDGESPADAALRETLEETGWRPTGAPAVVTVFHPSNGLSDQTFHIFHVEGAEHVGDPADATEASEVAWKSSDEVRSMIADGLITDGLSLTGLSVAFTIGVVGS